MQEFDRYTRKIMFKKMKGGFTKEEAKRLA
jgi:hypothetical protein